MLSNIVKRNIWLTFSVVTFACVISRAIKVIDGSAEWWQLFSTVVIFSVIFKMFLAYRKQVKAGNLFGKVNPFK